MYLFRTHWALRFMKHILIVPHGHKRVTSLKRLQFPHFNDTRDSVGSSKWDWQLTLCHSLRDSQINENPEW